MGILIVEDSETVAMLLHTLFSDAGYEDVTVVSTGEAALEVLTECEQQSRLDCDLDLVLMDIVLPGINGLDVCLQMGEMGHVGLIPVVFLTARSGEHVMAQAFEVGGWDFMVKPVADFELLVRVKAAIRKRVSIQNRISEQVSREKV